MRAELSLAALVLVSRRLVNLASPLVLCLLAAQSQALFLAPLTHWQLQPRRCCNVHNWAAISSCPAALHFFPPLDLASRLPSAPGGTCRSP